MKTDRYTLLRRPWRLPVALPHDLARSSSGRLACGVKERPPDHFPPVGGFAGGSVQPRKSCAARAASYLSAAPL
jgi:hypothetical protein